MQSCPCGELTKDTGNQCARCAALRTLDLPLESTEKEVENAHRTFVKVWHPDGFQHDEKLKKAAEDKMRAINAAYHFLTSAAGKDDYKPREQSTAADKTQTAPRPPRTFSNRLQLFWRALPRPTLLMAIAALVAGLCVIGFLAKTIDSYLMGEP